MAARGCDGPCDLPDVGLVPGVLRLVDEGPHLGLNRLEVLGRTFQAFERLGRPEPLGPPGGVVLPLDLVEYLVRDAEPNQRSEPVGDEPLRLLRPVPARVVQVVEDVGVEDHIDPLVLIRPLGAEEAGPEVGHPEEGEFAPVLATPPLLVQSDEAEFGPSQIPVQGPVTKSPSNTVATTGWWDSRIRR